MLTSEALHIISEYRDQHAAELTLPEFEAAGIAMVVLAALDPAERTLVDAILSQSDNSQN